MRRVLGNAALYVAASATLRLFAAWVMLWLATLATVEEYGRFGLLWAGQQFVTVVALGGIIEAVIGQIAKSDETEARKRLFLVARASFSYVGGTILLGAGIWAVIGSGSWGKVAQVVAVVSSGVFLAYASLLASLARLDERHAESNVFATVPALAAFAGGVAFVLATGDIAMFFFGSALLSAASLLIVRRLVGYGYVSNRGSPISSRGGQLLVLSLPLAGAALFGWLSGFGNSFLIERLFSVADVGRYTLILSLAAAIHLIAAALNSVWCPRFYRLFPTMPIDSLERINQSFYNMLAVLLGGAGGVLVVVFPLFASWLGGNLALYSDVGAGLAALVAGYIVATTWWQCSNHLFARGDGGTMLTVTVATGLGGMLAWIGLMLGFGTPGIYAGFTLMMGLRSAALLFATRKHTRVRWPWKGVATGCFLVWLGSIVPTLLETPLLQVVMSCLTGIAVITIVARRDLRRCLAAW